MRENELSIVAFGGHLVLAGKLSKGIELGLRIRGFEVECLKIGRFTHVVRAKGNVDTVGAALADEDVAALISARNIFIAVNIL